MDTPEQISSHASSSMPSQSNHELEDEVCEDETYDDVSSCHKFHLRKLVLTPDRLRNYTSISGKI